MDKTTYLDKTTIIQASSIIENAPQVVAKDRQYTTLYTLKCASCQSQNCTGPQRNIERKL